MDSQDRRMLATGFLMVAHWPPKYLVAPDQSGSTSLDKNHTFASGIRTLS